MNGVTANAKRIGRVPRYHRIAETLRERIRGGALAPGARLDNQRELAKSFAVTLMTLRQALELLEREHLITRRHGLGTFIAAPSIDYDILQLRRFAGDLSAKGEHVATRLLGARFAAPDRRVAEALRLPARARVFVLERLRLVDDHPMSLQRSFLPSSAPGGAVRRARPARRGGAATPGPGARVRARAAAAGRRPSDESSAVVPPELGSWGRGSPRPTGASRRRCDSRPGRACSCSSGCGWSTTIR